MRYNEKRKYNRFLEEALRTHGLFSIVDEVKVTPEFVEAHADLIDDERIWITIIRKQTHIKTEFFEKFTPELSFRVQVILSRRIVSDYLKKISK